MKRTLSLLVGIAIGVAVMQVVDWRWLESITLHATRAVHDEDDDEDDDEDTRRGAGTGQIGTGHVTLTADEIALAGLHTAPLQAARVAPEAATVGRVANVAELLGLLADMRSARATADANRAVVATLAARVAHLRKLDATGQIAVARELAALDVEHRRELATLAAQDARIAGFETALRAHWGMALAAQARAASAPLASLERGETVLVEFAADPAPRGPVYVASSDTRGAARPAAVIGAGVATLGAGNAASWLALAPAADLRVGMPVTVWVPRTASAVDGVVLPAAAVVWYHGMQWYYVADDATNFSRHSLASSALPYGRDYFLPTSQAPVAPVVLQGAQTLLSEEFHAAIPEEDDD